MTHELFSLITAACILFTALGVIAIFSVLGGNKKKLGSECV